MAFFNFVETFFFISLGITFVLVLLLVYHFKQRMTGLEQKCDTLFEIINDMVKELNMLRLQNTMQPQVPNFFHPMNNFVPQFNVNDILNTNSPSDENDDESEESSNVGNSEEDEEEDNEDNEDNEDAEEEEEEVEAEDEVVSPIKIINVNQETLADLDAENVISNDEDNNVDSDEEDKEEDEYLVEQNISSIITEDPILVEKIEPIEEEAIDESLTSNSKESDKEVYKKMSLGALKALVISKGLCSDARTMRKNDLLKLLEEE